ncbi:MAG: hypothetical protein KIT72_04710 [Polyangiaceae bacterium]|nr:hypothetical protein [Polyangiaceae bacterium]MCW5789705.1 hypothetical protein [Polyangiaceae bacterium]
MCCFSVAAPTSWLGRLSPPPKVHVSATNLFARRIERGVQALAYSMHLRAAREVAMILPLPVTAGAGEGAVRFIDLHEHPKMFLELAALFPQPIPRKGPFPQSRQLAPAPLLVVHEVGSFIASYVPTRADFTRLDPRFRLPSVLFDKVAHYSDYGFAVFQLKPGDQTIHPMAFTFPTRTPERLFFPTVHVHDGRWHDRAQFDHQLYFQHAEGSHYETSESPPTQTYAGLIDRAAPLQRQTIVGKHPNQDTWVDLG